METAKPALFIGSSKEGLRIAHAAEVHLRAESEVTLWNAGLFPLMHGTLEALVNSLDRFDFAVLVVTPDDLVTSRNETTLRGRDNVMFELGLFMGRLGRSRTFILCDPKAVNLPSDLAGVTVAVYDAVRADRSDSEAIAEASAAGFLISSAIRKLGIFDGRQAKRLRAAADDVENVSEIISRLIHLLARSRAVELDVISKQFGPLIASDSLGRMRKDLAELEEATKASDDIKTHRTKSKLCESFKRHDETIHESYILSNFASSDTVNSWLINGWVARESDSLKLTATGWAIVRARQQQS